MGLTFRSAFVLGCVAVIGSGYLVADHPRLTRDSMTGFARGFESRILTAWQDDSYVFVDTPRAYYLDNFGVVMSSVVNLAQPGIMIFRSGLKKEEIVSHHAKVLQRLPLLREQMKLALFDGAAQMGALSDDERLAVAVNVYHFAWEDTTEIPSQIVIQGRKKSLLEARAKTVDRGRDEALQMKELY